MKTETEAMSRPNPYALGRRGLLAAAGSVLASPAIVRAQGRTRGVALVIGNSRYSWEAPLPNVRRDAPDIAKRFQELGLKTELVQDADRTTMMSAVERLKAAAAGQEVAAYYYAGHGVSWQDDTYLAPVDSDLSNPSTVKSLVPVSAVSAAIQGAAHRILIFDNCHNNPSGGWRQRAASNSAFVNAAELTAASVHGANALVLFSTAPGRVALDGPPGQNSPFAAALLRQISGSTVDIAALPARLRRDLLLATGGQQVLWSESTYSGPFALSGGQGTAPAAPAIDMSRVIELTNAYAFARSKNLPLPEGLVAIRPTAASPEDMKLGSYETTFKQPLNNTRDSNVLEPLLFIVLSTANNNAQTILSFRDYYMKRQGKVWNFWEAPIVSGEIRFPAYDPPVKPFHMRWLDRNSGTCVSYFSPPFYQAKFTRLDG